MTVHRTTMKNYTVRTADGLGRWRLTAGDLRSLVRALDADGVPDNAQWHEASIGPLGNGGETSVAFRIDEEIEH